MCMSACGWSKLDVLPAWELFCLLLSSRWAVIRGLFHPQDNPNRGRRSSGNIGRQLDGQHTERVQRCLLYSTHIPCKPSMKNCSIIHGIVLFFLLSVHGSNLVLLWKRFLWCFSFFLFFLSKCDFYNCRQGASLVSDCLQSICSLVSMKP